ncbi:hypothetical protein GA0061096_0720 [Fictibacillus enclensis]|uniref:Uncharacterized protein n=1 Tax=Fictibacillus enclensis TaxID=1017270 RepID=A0A0V8JC73_9BACL|nr:hypothetical protein [Fictibacillus enclensis]KSU84603.1 hypothetical protein AS030_03415 [Fictibacillus enclensis]SCB82224.1 hypothetical protein GA0061096_0720 [Fictibacillus enclensis]
MAEEKNQPTHQEDEAMDERNEALDINGIMNLAGSVLNNKKDDEVLDLGGMMMMAANLLKDENLLGNLGFAQQTELLGEDQPDSEMEWLSRQLHDLNLQNAELKGELVAIKEQISETKEAISRLVEASQKKRWWQLG